MPGTDTTVDVIATPRARALSARHHPRATARAHSALRAKHRDAQVARPAKSQEGESGGEALLASCSRARALGEELVVMIVVPLHAADERGVRQGERTEEHDEEGDGLKGSPRAAGAEIVAEQS